MIESKQRLRFVNLSRRIVAHDAVAPVPLPCVFQVISSPGSVLSIVRRVSYVVQHDRPEMAASIWHLAEGFFMLIEQGLNRHQG